MGLLADPGAPVKGAPVTDDPDAPGACVEAVLPGSQYGCTAGYRQALQRGHCVDTVLRSLNGYVV